MPKKEKEFTLSVKIPSELHRRLREYTNKRGLKIQYAVAEAINDKVNAKYEGA